MKKVYCKNCRFSYQLFCGYSCNAKLSLAEAINICRSKGRSPNHTDLAISLNIDGSCPYYKKLKFLFWIK